MRHLKWMGGPAILGLLFLVSPESLANPVLQHAPEGVHVDQSSAHTTVIHQAPQKAIIDWHSHDIAAHETTHYQQPAGGVALSRIHSGQPTQIFGKLTATGRVILVNGAGIHFAPGSYVNVGSIIASSLDISDANFHAGRYVFDKPGQSGAKVINAGHIEAKEHGLVALIGPHIENHGLIEAQLGTVAMGAGDKVTMGFGPNDQLIQFAVEDDLVNSKHPEIKKVVENNGKIYVGAKHAKQVLDQAINMDGVQHATHATQVNGKIILHVGSASPVRVRNKASTHIKRNSQIKSPRQHPANLSASSASSPFSLSRSDSEYMLLDADAFPPQSPPLNRSTDYVLLDPRSFPASNPPLVRSTDYVQLDPDAFPPFHPPLRRSNEYVLLNSNDFLPSNSGPIKESVSAPLDHEPLLRGGLGGGQPNSNSLSLSRSGSVDSLNSDSSYVDLGNVSDLEEKSHPEDKQEGLTYSQGYWNRPLVDGFVPVPANSFEMGEHEIKDHYEVLPHPQAVFEHELEIEDQAMAPSPRPLSLRELISRMQNDDFQPGDLAQFLDSPVHSESKSNLSSPSSSMLSVYASDMDLAPAHELLSSRSSSISSASSDSSSSSSSISSASLSSSWLSVHDSDMDAVPAYELTDSKASLSPSGSKFLRSSMSFIPGGPSIPNVGNIPGGPSVPDVSDVSEVGGPPGGPALLINSGIPGGPSVPDVLDPPVAPTSSDEHFGTPEDDSQKLDLDTPDKPELPTQVNTDEEPSGGGGKEVATEPQPTNKAKSDSPPFCVTSTDDRLGNEDPLCIVEDEK